jgi:hypothetical protein
VLSTAVEQQVLRRCAPQDDNFLRETITPALPALERMARGLRKPALFACTLTAKRAGLYCFCRYVTGYVNRVQTSQVFRFMASSKAKAIFTDSHFWVPFLVLLAGIGLLVALH